jgi:hypothetical protein
MPMIVCLLALLAWMAVDGRRVGDTFDLSPEQHTSHPNMYNTSMIISNTSDQVRT